jgi:hypothetical protein
MGHYLRFMFAVFLVLLSRANADAQEIGGKEVIVLLPGGVPLEFLGIPAGSFLMGSEADVDYSNPEEAPVHEVTIGAPFLMSKYEFTQAQWEAVMGGFPTVQPKSDPDLPVVGVNWSNMAEFLLELEQLGLTSLRLPSEAEWEYACRAGSTTRWYFGDNVADLADHAWYAGNNQDDMIQQVGQKIPNAFGLYDMSGNAWEFVQDAWNSYYIGAPTDGSVWTAGDVGRRVIRGGDFAVGDGRCRCAARGFNTVPNRPADLGFRVVADVVPALFHSSDWDQSGTIVLSELLRVVQFYNTGGLHCPDAELDNDDGYAAGANEAAQDCGGHASDYAPRDWRIELGELLRTIAFYNSDGYALCPDGEDGYCPLDL